MALCVCALCVCQNHSRWRDKSKEEVLCVKGLWGLEWGNVVGIAAGFDKHAMAMQVHWEKEGGEDRKGGDMWEHIGREQA